MKAEEYQALAMRTSPDNHDRILNGCLGLIGEAGEIVDIVKKWKFQSGEDPVLPTDKLIEECGDLLWYCAELATGLDCDLYSIYSEKKHYFEDITNFVAEDPIELAAGRLGIMAGRPFLWSQDRANGNMNEADAAFFDAKTKAELAGILVFVSDFLMRRCHSSLEDAMEKNIAKLRKRYPDGFDPERSLHRP